MCGYPETCQRAARVTRPLALEADRRATESGYAKTKANRQINLTLPAAPFAPRDPLPAPSREPSGTESDCRGREQLYLGQCGICPSVRRADGQSRVGVVIPPQAAVAKNPQRCEEFHAARGVTVSIWRKSNPHSWNQPCVELFQRGFRRRVDNPWDGAWALREDPQGG